MTNKKTIAVDMDDVLSDDEQQYSNWYARETGKRISKADMSGKPEKEALPDKTAVERYLKTPGFFRDIPVMEGAVDAIQRLQQQYDIYIVTSAFDYPHSLTEKYQWLKQYFPFIEEKYLVFCGSKDIIATDYMIDDKVSNLEGCQARGILFSAGHNVGQAYEPRVNSWKEAVDLLLP